MNALIDAVVKKFLPFDTYTKMVQSRDRKNRDKIIAEWKEQGRPAPLPHAVKQVMIENYQKQSGYKTLVETGTFLGEMVEAQRNNFEKIYSIELSEKLWQKASKRFAKYNHIKIVQGDSGKMLGKIVTELTGPAIFWLDGHYSAGFTARGDKDCPIFEEIEGIFNGPKFNHILIVDDAMLFVGKGDYPTVDELTKFVQSKDVRYKVLVEDNVIRYTI